MSAETNTTIIDDADLKRTLELADEIDRILRISEATESIVTDPAVDVLGQIQSSEESGESLTSTGNDVERILSDVDQILNRNQ